MPLIKSRARKVTYVRHAYRLATSMRDVLVQYAKFIDESPDYVLNAVIEATLAKPIRSVDLLGTLGKLLGGPGPAAPAPPLACCSGRVLLDDLEGRVPVHSIGSALTDVVVFETGA